MAPQLQSVPVDNILNHYFSRALLVSNAIPPHEVLIFFLIHCRHHHLQEPPSRFCLDFNPWSIWKKRIAALLTANWQQTSWHMINPNMWLEIIRLEHCGLYWTDWMRCPRWYWWCSLERRESGSFGIDFDCAVAMCGFITFICRKFIIEIALIVQPFGMQFESKSEYLKGRRNWTSDLFTYRHGNHCRSMSWNTWENCFLSFWFGLEFQVLSSVKFLSLSRSRSLSIAREIKTVTYACLCNCEQSNFWLPLNHKAKWSTNFQHLRQRHQS